MSRISRHARWPWIVALIGLALFASTAALTPVSNNDVWIHLTTGRLILEEGSVPTQDRYSFTAAGNRYVAHEWLAACLYAVGEKLGGTTGVIVVAKLLPTLALAAALLVAAAAAGARADGALLLGVAAFTAARHRIVARPELLALVLLLLTFAILWRHHRRGKDRPAPFVLGLIPLQILWVNVHGSFPLGPGLVLLFAAVEAGNDLLDREGVAARVVRGLLVASGAAVALWLTSLEPASFGNAAGGVVAAGVLLLALDGAAPLFRDAGTGSLRGAAWLLAVALAMALASIVSPHGAGIFLFPFEFTTGSNLVTSQVVEWRPLLDSPSLLRSLALPGYLALLSVASFTFALAARAGRLRRLDLALLLVLLVLPLRHSRWMALVALGLTPCLASVLALGRELAPSPETRHRVLAVGFCLLGLPTLVTALVLAVRCDDATLTATLVVALACGLLALCIPLTGSTRAGPGLALGCLASGGLASLAVLHGIPEIAGAPRRSGLGVSPLEPMAAVAYLDRHDVHGRLFTEYEWAGYAIHALWPETKVFLDSRSEVYPEELLLEYQRIMSAHRGTIQRLEAHGADLVLVRHIPHPARSPRSTGILRALEQSSDWDLLYLDDRAIVYGKQDVDRPLPAGYGLIEPRRLRPGDSRIEDPGFEAEVRRALEEAPHSAVLRWALASALHASGRIPEARAELKRAWAANPFYPTAPQLAGELAREAGEPEVARRWFERARRAAPDWEAPRRALAELER